MFSVNCWSQTDPFTTKSNNIYCQYLKFFKLILSRFPQCKKLQRNKNSQYLQFLKLELSPYPQFKRYRKVVKIKLDIKIHNFHIQTVLMLFIQKAPKRTVLIPPIHKISKVINKSTISKFTIVKLKPSQYLQFKNYQNKLSWYSQFKKYQKCLHFELS